MMLECGCPGEYPEAWHQQDIDLGGTCVHELGIPTLMHMPLAYEAYKQRQQQALVQLALTERWPGLILTRTGFLRGSLMRLLEDGQSLSRHVRTLPNPFHLRAHLHQGNVGTIRKAIRAIQEELLDHGRMPRELYLCHLTCPSCAERRGGDKILLLRRWQPSRVLGRRRG